MVGGFLRYGMSSNLGREPVMFDTSRRRVGGITQGRRLGGITQGRRLGEVTYDPYQYGAPIGPTAESTDWWTTAGNIFGSAGDILRETVSGTRDILLPVGQIMDIWNNPFGTPQQAYVAPTGYFGTTSNTWMYVVGGIGILAVVYMMSAKGGGGRRRRR
jgi:hypothetical protein